MAPALDATFGNPSSVHGPGRAARAMVDSARDGLAAVLNASSREVVFTGGGSEADNLALRGVVSARPTGHLVVSAVEHEAVLETARDLEAAGYDLTVLPVDSTGRVQPQTLEAALRPETVLVSVMTANNEVGTVQPVRELADLVHASCGAVFHTDATQALGKLRLDVAELGVDLLTISAHKVYGPKGVGALYLRRGVVVDPQITGGGQERTRRSGTENVAGIVGLAVAAQLAEGERDREMERQGALARLLTEQIVADVPGVLPTGARGAGRLANFCTLAFPEIEGELLLMRLDRAGVYGSAGSACASGSLAPSHVLLAMGLPPALAAAHLRLTLGRQTTADQVQRAAAIVTRETAALRASTVAV